MKANLYGQKGLNMEIILSIIFLVGIWAYFKVQDGRACNYSQSHQIDWGRVNYDRAINDLSNSQVNQNILNGKYNKPAVPISKSSNDTWEDFKRRHPHGSWN